MKWICLKHNLCNFPFDLFQKDDVIDDSCLVSQTSEVPIDELEHSRAPSPQKSDEESVIFETQMRSTKCPTGSRKRTSTESGASEIMTLHNIQEAMNKDGADDSLDMYGKVVLNKLRLFADPWNYLPCKMK